VVGSGTVSAAWTRDQWANAQINSRCSELERDLAIVMKDDSLNHSQKAFLCRVAFDAAAGDLANYEWFKQPASPDSWEWLGMSR
jgi:hypothetical protein